MDWSDTACTTVVKKKRVAINIVSYKPNRYWYNQLHSGVECCVCCIPRTVGVVPRMVTELLSSSVYNTRVGSGVDSKNSKQQAGGAGGGAKGGQLYLGGS